MPRALPLVFVLALVVTACRATAIGPVDTVAAYTQALREGRLPDAWRMLSDSTRRALPYEDFERVTRERPDELRETVAAYERVDPALPLTARLALPGGDEVSLLYEDGAWRLDPSSLDFYGQQTPRQALRSFTRAVERQRWDVLLRLSPRSAAAQTRMASSQASAAGRPAHTAEEFLRDAWTGPRADHDREVLRRLREALDRGVNVEIAGDRATLTYGVASRYVAVLVREDGLWKVEDPDSESTPSRGP